MITDEQVAAFIKAHHWALVEASLIKGHDSAKDWYEAVRAGIEAAIKEV